ncbi:MAG: hypothetical protein H0U27_00060, partial [Nitrosopumilus sp.]|nr:hypothetical protein [Nitrosopumilus sp.]
MESSTFLDILANIQQTLENVSDRISNIESKLDDYISQQQENFSATESKLEDIDKNVKENYDNLDILTNKHEVIFDYLAHAQLHDASKGLFCTHLRIGSARCEVENCNYVIGDNCNQCENVVYCSGKAYCRKHEFEYLSLCYSCSKRHLKTDNMTTVHEYYT